MLVTHVRRHVEQGAAGVGPIGDLDGVQGRVADVTLVGAIVRIREGGGVAVEGRVSDALVTVVEILATRARWTVLQLTELHLLAGLAGVAARALAPKVVPCHVASAIVIARVAHAYIVRYHAFEDFVVVERHVAEDRHVNALCLKDKFGLLMRNKTFESFDRELIGYLREARSEPGRSK